MFVLSCQYSSILTNRVPLILTVITAFLYSVTHPYLIPIVDISSLRIRTHPCDTRTFALFLFVSTRWTINSPKRQIAILMY